MVKANRLSSSGRERYRPSRRAMTRSVAWRRAAAKLPTSSLRRAGGRLLHKQDCQDAGDKGQTTDGAGAPDIPVLELLRVHDTTLTRLQRPTRSQQHYLGFGCEMRLQTSRAPHQKLLARERRQRPVDAFRFEVPSERGPLSAVEDEL